MGPMPQGENRVEVHGGPASIATSSQEHIINDAMSRARSRADNNSDGGDSLDKKGGGISKTVEFEVYESTR